MLQMTAQCMSPDRLQKSHPQPSTSNFQPFTKSTSSIARFATKLTKLLDLAWPARLLLVAASHLLQEGDEAHAQIRNELGGPLVSFLSIGPYDVDQDVQMVVAYTSTHANEAADGVFLLSQLQKENKGTYDIQE